LADKGKNKKTKGGNGEDKELKDRLGEMEGSSNNTKKTSGPQDEEVKRKEEEEMIKKLQEEIDKLTTKDIIVQMMMSLSSLAYKKMGIPIGVNDRYKDKMQAKLAIDCFDALLKTVSDEVSGQENENLKSSLSNLQINFVKTFI
jgi:hypothetical protein